MLLGTTTYEFMNWVKMNRLYAICLNSILLAWNKVNPTASADKKYAAMKLFRAMIEDIDGLPRIGPEGRLLGVRPGNSPSPYVTAMDPHDLVLPGHGGMSVAPNDPANLPRHRSP